MVYKYDQQVDEMKTWLWFLVSVLQNVFLEDESLFTSKKVHTMYTVFISLYIKRKNIASRSMTVNISKVVFIL